MIHVGKEIIKGMGVYIIALMVMIPIILIITSLMMDAVNDGIQRDKLPVEAQKNYDSIMATAGIIPIIMIIFGVFITLTRSDAGRIIKTANIEKRMEKLKKLGADKFVEQTKGVLIHCSERGNYLYKTEDVIKGKTLKFLVYDDISTDRKYISFVTDEHVNADEAMASKFSLSQNEYTMLKRNNES